MRAVVRVAAAFGVALLLAPRARAGDDPPQAPGARLAAGGAAAPAPAKGTPTTDGTTTLRGRVVRGGRGVVARVRVWNLGSEETEDRVSADRSFPFDGEEERPGAVAEAHGLTRAAARRAARAIADPGGALPADAEGSSGEDGSLRLDVPGPSTYDRLVVATAGDGAGAFRHVRGSLLPGETALRLPLPPAPPDSSPRLTVTVQRSDGTPYVGAVMLLPAASDMPVAGVRFAVRPKDDGSLVFLGVPTGGWRLRCTDEDGYGAFSDAMWLPRAEPFVFVVDEPSHEVRGSVTSSAGGAIAGAEVVWDGQGPERTASFLVRTGEDGTFRMRLPKRSVSVGVSAPGHEGASAEVGSDAATVSLVLPAHARLRGRVVDAASGAPVAGVPVFVAEGDEFALSPGPDFVAISGSDGAFAVENHRTGPVHLLAFGGGFMSVGLEDVVPDGYDPLVVDPASPPEGGFVLRVVPVGRLEGRVVDEEGAGVAGVRVSVSQADRMQAECGNGYHRDPIVPFLPDPADVLTDAGGRFVAAPLRPALLYHVSLSRAGFTSRWEGLSLEEGGTTTHAFRLAHAPEGETRPFAIVVRVTDADTRAPLAGAVVRVLSSDEPAPESVADGTGVARLEGVVGAYRRVEASAEGYLTGSEWARPAPARGGAPLEMAIALRAAHDVAGRVVDAAGAPVAGATVVGGTADGSNAAEGRTTADGRFVLHGLEGGQVALSAWLRRSDGRQDRGETDVSAGATDVVLTLREARPSRRHAEPAARPEARFRVVGPDGAPTSSGSYRVLTEHTRPGVYVRDSSFRKGVIDVSPDDRSTWWLEVYGARASGGGPLLAPTLTPPLPPGATPTDGVIRCGEGAVLQGRVVTPNGEPVAGVGLFASREPAPTGERRTLTLSEARTGSNGRFRLEGLPAEAVSLSFDLPGAWLPPRETRFDASRGPVEIVLRQAVLPWITVVDPQGEPVVGALLAVGPDGSKPSPNDWDRTTPRTGSKGRCRLGGLDPEASYVLAVEGPQGDAGRPAFLPFVLAGWRPGDTTVRLTPPGQLTGRVRTPTGEPLPAVRLYLAPGGSAADVEGDFQSQTDEEGRFVLGNLKPGPVLLRYRVGDQGPLSSLDLTVPSPDLDLRLDPGPTWTLTLEGVPDAPRGGLEVLWTPWQDASGAKRDAVVRRRLPLASPIRFHGLRPDRHYAVWVYAAADGLVGFLPDLPGVGGTRSLALRPEGVLTGTVRFADPAEERASSHVWLETLGFTVYDFPGRDGAFTLKGLPPGRFTIHAEAMGDDEDGPTLPPSARAQRHVTLEGSPGEVVHFVIPARPR